MRRAKQAFNHAEERRGFRSPQSRIVDFVDPSGEVICDAYVLSARVYLGGRSWDTTRAKVVLFGKKGPETVVVSYKYLRRKPQASAAAVREAA